MSGPSPARRAGADAAEEAPGDTAIGELAEAFGVTPRAIRFYEDQGLIRPKRVGTMRIYGPRDRARLQLILRGKRLGFSLTEIARWLDLYDLGDGQRRQLLALRDACRSRIDELERRREDIRQTLEELRDIDRQTDDRLRAQNAVFPEGATRLGAPEEEPIP